ncbi:hypothetical protein [Streptomyces sp. Agncl-13]|uniref:hypothetical protein n=1 Tax=Streptomyces sp. Agncl-13 TaxID=3400628 RepID=UPI003A8AEE4D
MKVTRKASEAVEVKRREAELSGRFLAFLNEQGHVVERFKIRVKGLTSTFFTDLYDQTDNALYELKGSSSRNAVRMAVGQLLDYRRHIPPKSAKLVVVLPKQPEDDLADLVESAGMKLVYEDGDNFVGWPALLGHGGRARLFVASSQHVVPRTARHARQGCEVGPARLPWVLPVGRNLDGS